MTRAQGLSSFAGLGLILVGGAFLITSMFRKSVADRRSSADRAGIEKRHSGAKVADVEDRKKP